MARPTRRGEATLLLASLTKAKDPPRSCTSAGRLTLARLVARVSGPGSASLATRPVASWLASWPSLSAMSMILSELETTFVIKFTEKELLLGYLMIIAKVFESVFELSNTNVKFKVLND